MRYLFFLFLIIIIIKSQSQIIEISCLDSLKKQLFFTAFLESKHERIIFTVINIENDSITGIEYCNSVNALYYFMNNRILIKEKISGESNDNCKKHNITNPRNFVINNKDSSYLFLPINIYDSLYRIYERQINISFIKNYLKTHEYIYLDSMIPYDTNINKRINIQIISHLLFNNGILSGVVGGRALFRAFGEFYYRRAYPDSELLYWYLVCN